ncbi:siderophore-interacting protein [Microbacterium sp. G2-8]|uniref:siderophore-interacting protein n=1 Tax=Microbacterium sp. G2-8 TaxID=2842454 RepID=UPI001C8A87E6|nr:siderophore-interacting protein [Microbacterium sp. G2-8]
MTPSFLDSPNALFGTTVRVVSRLSPAFTRVTLAGPQLAHLVPRGLDQRIKILLSPAAYPAELDRALLPEAEWRREWRDLPRDRRPVLRSYTVSSARPEGQELDIDFFHHATEGPACTWARRAQVGDRLLVSAPDARRDAGRHGVQWDPGSARRVLICGDETAFPAVRGIVRDLPADVAAEVLVEAADPRDAEWLRDDVGDRLAVVLRAAGQRGGDPLAAAVGAWARDNGATAASAGDGFYAWCATESQRVARIRSLLGSAGIRSDRVHVQEYWNDRPRA